MNQVATVDNQNNNDLIEKVVMKGDLSGMTQSQKIQYYHEFCKSLGLNPLTQPFQIINFKGKEVLYATKDCTEQLRKLHNVSIVESKTEEVGDLLITRVKAQNAQGRMDVGTGVVMKKGLYGEALANAIMKAETKAKRRVTLSICGLGILDESETDTIGPHTTMPVEEAKPVKEADWLEGKQAEPVDDVPSRQIEEEPGSGLSPEDENLVKAAEEIFTDDIQCTCNTKGKFHKKDCPLWRETVV
jgi:CxxC motif-containing protein (DUF1111 family)